MQVGRIVYEPPSTYSNKVYIGNWYEDRCAYKKSRFPLTSTYKTAFNSKPYSANDPNIMWKTKIEQEGCGPRLMTDHGKGEFLNNLATLYDLSYNHYPKCTGGPIHRMYKFRIPKYIPEDDYLPTFGNITKYGILEEKSKQWKYEKAMARTTGTTHYQDTFVSPKKEDFGFKVQWRKPRCNPITWLCPPNAEVPKTM